MDMKQSSDTNNIMIGTPRFECIPKRRFTKGKTSQFAKVPTSKFSQTGITNPVGNDGETESYFAMPTKSAITVDIDLEEIDDRLELLQETVDNFDMSRGKKLLKIVSNYY